MGIGEASGLEMVDIADCTPDSLMEFDGLICGAPTWHTGADSERSGTAWDDFLYGDLASMDLRGKKVAVFGLGDQGGYGDNFCDAMDELVSCFSKQGAEISSSRRVCLSKESLNHASILHLKKLSTASFFVASISRISDGCSLSSLFLLEVEATAQTQQDLDWMLLPR